MVMDPTDGAGGSGVVVDDAFFDSLIDRATEEGEVDIAAGLSEMKKDHAGTRAMLKNANTKKIANLCKGQ